MRGASTVNGLHGMYLHHRLNSSRLVVLLQPWTRDDGARAAQLPQPDVAQTLSQWLGTVDAVQLSRALHAIESLPEAGRAGAEPGLAIDLAALDRFVQKAQADLSALLTARAAAPKPLRARADNTPMALPDPEADADFGAHGPRYLELQRQMDTRLLALRAQVRHAIAKGRPALRQLAALDAVMEQMLGAREQRLWASLPGYLERRLAHRRHQQQALRTAGQDDAPQRWRQPGGWLWDSERNLQALLLAEMQVRLQPITGLLEAAHNETTGRQE